MAEEKFDPMEKALECLRTKKPIGTKLTASEVVEWIEEKYSGDCKKIRVQSSDKWKTLSARIGFYLKGYAMTERSDITFSDSDEHGNEQRRRFWYVGEGRRHATVPTKTAETKHPLREADLYPKVGAFLQDAYGIHSKRIDERNSSNKMGRGGNRWLYPDVVGVEDLSRSWEGIIKECVEKHSDKKVKLWSFEVKTEIRRSNVRECFFQAVSNSSWANYGYLVAAQLEYNAEDELRILSALHGIGFILLDDSMPKKGSVLIPARERVDVDWNTANRIAEANTDFADYIERVSDFLQTGRLRL